MTPVYFSSNRGGTYQIFEVDSDGTTPPVQVTIDGAHHYSFVMPSPDKTRLLCARLPASVKASMGTDAAQTVDLVIIDVASGVTSIIAEKAGLGLTELGHAEWSPDGREIVAYAATSTGSRIIVLDATRFNTVKRVIDTVPANQGLVIDPAFTPDGRSIVYVRRLGWHPDRSGIYRADVTDGGNRRLVLAENNRLIFDPQPSPSGDVIAFLEFYLPGGWWDWNLKRVNADGSNEQPILSDNWLWSRGIWLDDYWLVTHGSRGKGLFGFTLGGAAIWKVGRDGKRATCLVDTNADEVIPSA